MGENYRPFDHNDISKGKKAILEEDYRWLKSNIKSTSLLANVLIKIKPLTVMLMKHFSLDGFLTEGSASNVFCVKDKVIKTPKLSNKLLPGITRKFLTDLITQHKLSYSECVIFQERIY